MKITYQGTQGAYSHIACETLFPNCQYIGFNSFEEAMNEVNNKKADYAVIPVENSSAGRVSDVHFLLPNMKLFIVGEFFLKIEHQLWGINGACLNDIKEAYSHQQALAQCSNFLKKHKIKPISRIDTSLSCQEIIEKGDKSIASIASKKAGEINNLTLLAADIHNANNNTTRFLVLSNKNTTPKYDKNTDYISSFVFRAKNIPAALYKALGGFATNGINITKIESYLLNGEFVSAQFYIEAMGHPDEVAFKNAIEELKFFCHNVQLLGTYRASDYR